MDDAEWEGFKTLLGTEWLRSKIASAIQRDKRKATKGQSETEYILSTKANSDRLLESVAQFEASKKRSTTAQ